ncbi:Por secretion system C-terminal sorting domain-containing protein [Flavobacterium longum]|uniref:T9SS type A sorting domain-containing protein n=1 Tax=Flavobacterium longum TaxID=1299340 RepID=UPI0039E89052
MKKITLTLLLLSCWLIQGQAVSSYQFSQASEVYSAVSGTNSTAVGDDGTENDIPIGFTFPYGGTDYTTFSISTNGFIRLGAAIGGNNWLNALSNTAAQAPLIAAFWDDNNRNGGSIQYALSGAAPDQTLEIGWNQVNIGNNGQPNNTVSASFKIRLHESGTIEIVYGPQMTWTGGVTASIGLNDATSFLSVTPAATGATASSATANNAILATTDIAGNKYVFAPQSCSGTPIPGATLASATAICAGFDLVLSLENEQIGSGISYQWQSSEDGVSFSDIADSNAPEITVTQTVVTTYQCIVTCALGDSAVSTPVTVSITTTGCYCVPGYTFGKTDGDLISNVSITGTTLSNNTGTVEENPAYTYFTGQPNYTATLEAGTSYQIQVTVGSFGQQNSAVWIDYNDDEVFSADERVGYTIAQTGSFGTAIYTIQLGCDAPTGLHRMRVRDVWNTDGIDIDPCATYGYGETEDYDVTIVPQTTCPVATDVSATAIAAYSAQLEWASGCGHVSWDVFVTPAGGSIGAATHPNVTSPLIVMGLDAFTNYEFYVLAHCETTGDSIWAGPFAFTTAPEPVENDECDTAFSLTVGGTFDDNAVLATNAGATQSLGQPTPDCAAFNFGGDIWYSIVVPESGSVTVETRQETGSLVADTGLSLYSGGCELLTALGCSDDEGEGAFSLLSVTGLMPGTTIYARVWEYANDALGTFKISAYDASLGSGSVTQSVFVAYPNPVRNILNVAAQTDISQVSVFNLLGQQILSQKFNEASGQLDMTPLPAGTYLVKLTSGNQVQTVKVIKE